MGKKSKAAPPRSSESVVLTKFFFKLLAVYVVVNTIVQIAKKPTELLSLLAFTQAKTPPQTWRSYKDYFVDYSTPIVSAPLLAAIAQVESGGNPWASPPWRFRLNSRPFEVYGPMTSAVGLYQFLDETFNDAAANGKRVAGGSIFTRLSAQTSTQIAADYLDREIRNILSEGEIRRLGPERLDTLAAVIHLCGKQKGLVFARSNFAWSRVGSCGAHDPRRYVAQVNEYKGLFATFYATYRAEKFASSESDVRGR
ncbi:MAG: transglycosylase SLT domain-containing protein [Bdellovibrionales bacterium]|nr:transglycosylase SLT domain-containing protein [Bdellovibrionales bacterium]